MRDVSGELPATDATDGETVVDFITGRKIPDVGSEGNRQRVERFLVEEKGYAREDIEVDVPMEVPVQGEIYRSKIDLLARVNGTPFMAIKCAAASLGSWEREIVAAARLLGDFQVPFSLVSDGDAAILLDTVSGKKIGEGWDPVPSRDQAAEQLKEIDPTPFPEKRLDRERLIFRSYDSMNVNRNPAA